MFIIVLALFLDHRMQLFIIVLALFLDHGVQFYKGLMSKCLNFL